MVDTVNKKLEKTNVLHLAKLIEEHKGENTIVLYVGDISSWTDFFIITTIRSTRHLSGLFREIKLYLNDNNITIINNSRTSNSGGWALLDCGSFIIHLMEKQERDFYELEKLWFNGVIIFQSSKSS